MAIDDYSRALPMVEDTPEVDQRLDGVHIKRRGNNAVVDFNPGMESVSSEDSAEHSANIAELLPIGEQTTLVDTIVEQVQADLDSRRDWQRRIDQSMELLGLRNTPMEDLAFEGAAAVTYPLIGEACVQFQARAIEEVFPSEGPCKTKIIGETTVEREEQAERVKNHMNYQMVEEDKAYFWHTDQMLFWLPLAGSVFKKTYYDPISDMVVSRVVQSGDFIVPYMATDLRTSPRYTHRLMKDESEMKRLMSSKFYREIELVKPSNAMTDTEDSDTSQEMRDEADDRQRSMHEDDYVYELYEMHCDLELEMDQKEYANTDQERIGQPLPYVVTVDRQSMELLSVRRNWREQDELFEKRLWFTHYKYLPGLGFYGFGLLHLIGSVAESSTGVLRALLDSAAFANMQGGFVSDEAKIDPQDAHIAPGVWKQVKMTAEEMGSAFYTPPFKEPSPALAKLFETLTDAGRRFASITEATTGEGSNTGPVGTTIAMIEQSSKVFSAVHRRLHVAQAEEFSLRAELNFEWLEEDYPYEADGKDLIVMKADYDGRVDVIPVSDPNIFSSTQRIAQAQAMIDLAERFPGKLRINKVLERFLKAIRVPDYEEILTTDNSNRRMDPINENMLFLTGGGAKAYLEQDHDAHIQVHMSFTGGLNDQAMQVVGAPMEAHLAEHYAYKYFNEMNAQLGGQLPPPTFMDQDVSEDDEMEPEIEMMISQAAAQAEPIQLMPPDEEGPDAEQAAFEAEEGRKAQSFDSEEERKSIAFEAEQERKDDEVDQKGDRVIAETLIDQSRKEEDHQNTQRKKEEDHQNTQSRKKKGDK